jgi:hypothetical protein
VGISTVFKIFSYFNFLRVGVLKIFSYFNFLSVGLIPGVMTYRNHWMLLNTRKKKICGLGVEISTIFEIFSNFLFLGGGVEPRGQDVHTIECY